MLEVLGKYYYIDVDKIIEKCRPVYEKEEEIDERQLELNVFKFECYKSCVERVLSEYQDEEDGVSAFTNKSSSPSFGIAFNTLYKNEILKEDE